jgi:hypothetical protein
MILVFSASIASTDLVLLTCQLHNITSKKFYPEPWHFETYHDADDSIRSYATGILCFGIIMFVLGASAKLIMAILGSYQMNSMRQQYEQVHSVDRSFSIPPIHRELFNPRTEMYELH